MRKITSWSFSRWYDYKVCPAKAKYKHIDRLPEPPNNAMDRGIKIHDMIAKYIAGDKTVSVKELLACLSVNSPALVILPLLKRLRANHKKLSASVVVESSWAFTSSWKKTTYDDWKGCAVRIKVDCARVHSDSIEIYDWKTGKVKEPSRSSNGEFFPSLDLDLYHAQLQLYALSAFYQFTDLKKAHVRLGYVDHDYLTQPVIYKRDDLPALTEEWGKRVLPMLTDTAFKPTPSRSCMYCHYRKSNGGPCEY